MKWQKFEYSNVMAVKMKILGILSKIWYITVLFILKIS